MVLNYLRHRHSVWKSVYYDIDAKIVESENNQIKDTNARGIVEFENPNIPFWVLRISKFEIQKNFYLDGCATDSFVLGFSLSSLF